MKYGAKISNCVGDGVSKTYGNLNTKECLGHVQKTGKVVKAGKFAGKKRRSNGKITDNLSRYYEAAIKHNCDSVEKMKNAIWTTYSHQQSTHDNTKHDKCLSCDNFLRLYQNVKKI